MNIMLNYNFLNFCSGFSPKIKFKEQLINPKKQQIIISKNYGIETLFLDNKSFALATQLCLKVFKQLAKNLQLPLKYPPAIIFYNKNDLVNKNWATNFCIPDTKEVLKNDYPFLGRSIFFQKFKNLKT